MPGGAPERGFAQLQLERAHVESASGAHNRVRPLAAGTTSAPWHPVENVVSVVENALENVVECVLANVL